MGRTRFEFRSGNIIYIDGIGNSYECVVDTSVTGTSTYCDTIYVRLVPRPREARLQELAGLLANLLAKRQCDEVIDDLPL